MQMCSTTHGILIEMQMRLLLLLLLPSVVTTTSSIGVVAALPAVERSGHTCSFPRAPSHGPLVLAEFKLLRPWSG